MKTNTLKLFALGLSILIIAGTILYLEAFFGGQPQLVSTPQGPQAPDVQGIEAWINSPPLSLEEVKGKVVLVDFWTYSCINCIRTLPYLTSWDEKYRDDGLLIIGVHSPEFFFEHDLNNVKKAVEENGIAYPVALDNNFKTWKAYGNHYWPRKYLIDKNGIIRYDHIGEGAYEETEAKIVELLNEIKTVEERESQVFVDPNLGNAFPGVTGEIYAGYQRGAIGNPEGYEPGEIVDYQDPGIHAVGKLYFHGPWFNYPEYMELRGEGHLVIAYLGSVVNVVLASDEQAAIEVSIDGHYLGEEEKGSDIVIQNGKSMVTIDSSRLYNLIGNSLPPGEHEVTLASSQPFQVYAFTFGV